MLDFLRAQGCETTAEELTAFLKNRMSGELSDEEPDNASGGGCNTSTGYEALYSTITAGLMCTVWALESADSGYVGQKEEEDGRLCN